MNKCYTQP